MTVRARTVVLLAPPSTGGVAGRVTVETRQWLFQDRQVMTRWGRVVHASVVQTGTAQMLTLCGRPVARDAEPGRSGRRCVICFPTVGAYDLS